MMRVSRAEEALFGSSRPAFQGRIKMGFRADGRVTAVDLYIVQQNGPYNGGGDLGGAAGAVSLLYQPPAMRYRGVPVSTNTTPTGAQRGPGQNQIAAALEPLIDKAAQSARPRSRRDSPHQRRRQRRQVRLAARARHERVSARSARARRGRVRLGSAQSAQRPDARLEGHRHRHRPSVSRRRPRRPRRHRAHHARRQAAHPLRRRQSRHVLVRGDVARRGRGAEGEVGQLHHRARRLALGACRSRRRSPAATRRSRCRARPMPARWTRSRSSRRSRRRRSAAPPTTTTSTNETVFAKADRTQEHDVRRGRAARDRARRPLQRSRSAGRHQRRHEVRASRRSRARA